MFNFFNEIKTKFGIKEDAFYPFNIVNIGGRILYVEGNQGIVTLSTQRVVFKVKRGQVVVEGSGLVLAELNEQVLYLQGKIDKVESVV